MGRFYEPISAAIRTIPSPRDAEGKLIRRSFWLDMSDRSLVLAMTQGVGAALSNDHKRAHLADIGRAHVDRRRVRAGDIAAREIGGNPDDVILLQWMGPPLCSGTRGASNAT